MGTIGTISRQSGRRGGSRITAWLQSVERMMEKRRTRRALLELTDYQLKDIGLSRSQVHREASRPFWD